MIRSIFWKPYRRLLIVGDNAGWSVDEDAIELCKSATKLGIPARRIRRAYFNLPQVVHYTSQFSLNEPSIYKSRHRISVDYYHGKPEQGENFKKCFDSLKEHHRQISRVRVSTREMEGVIKSSGIEPSKVMRIPIGIDTGLFQPQTQERKRAARERLGIPQNAIVIGSFQKDGMGWGEGNEPKLIKGPDIFLEVIGRLKENVPNLWVLLSGPARGYVKSGLSEIDVPHKHVFLEDFKKLPDLYDALDLYIITSREEGGPKACLESMAKGVPLVTTAVGQCKDLVKNGENALMAELEDTDTLSRNALGIIGDARLRQSLVTEGLITSKNNNIESQLILWKEYFSQLIN